MVFSLFQLLFMLQGNISEKRIWPEIIWICMPYGDSSHSAYLVHCVPRKGAGALVKQVFAKQ